jgi:hypothetical protein
VFLGGSALRWLQNSPDNMTLIAADIWDHHTENWVFQMAREPASWIVDSEPVMAVQAPLKEYGIYKVALHNLRDFRDRVIPPRMRVATLYGYVRTLNPKSFTSTQTRNDRTMFSRMRLFQGRSCAATIGSARTQKANMLCGPSCTRWPRPVIATLSPSGRHGF